MNVNKLVKQRLLCQQHYISMRSVSGWFDKEKRKFFQLNTKEEPRFFSETEPNPLSDLEQRIEKSKQKLQWRKPFPERTSIITEGLRLLAPERTRHFFEVIQRPLDKSSILRTLEFKKYEMMAQDQRFLNDRHRILGNDLAAAHFLVARGGQVRFTRSNKWIIKNKYDEYDLPRQYDPEYLIDAIKCDNMDLMYEGLENVRRLHHLKYFSLRNVKYFDDWCMDRLCGNQFDKIEILDVSGTSITANALYAVPKLRSLKAIVLDTVNRSIEFQLACSLLEEVMPNLRILSSADVHDDVHEALQISQKSNETATEVEKK
ncbi:distal membrane-arm assembly complex protein 2 [Sitodiplosis mosellana]|uniref:distal membrane-arm assembly complex protein 2 n=1 Tax=Sitodiplosis mosellana TaxID=263140 RepID=UPI0024440A19|nr:distal membrane-arm assembly complex protein 2 [Sitodiplosis mosellana]